MKTCTIITAAATLLAGTTSAATFDRRAAAAAGPLVAADIIAAVAPTSVSCTGASVADECRTNVQVAPALIDAYLAYGIYEPTAMASILALLALESGEFRYKRNLQHAKPDATTHWGQGTANMQGADFNVEFAKSFPELASKVAEGTTMEIKNKNLDLVVDDRYNFKSGAWFYKTKCPDAQQAFKGTDYDAAFAAHMACVGVPATDESRQKYWQAAKKAFGLA
ncbi:putative chitinase [Microdochium nivale]|nr:putative chitinase [Microdochium nivale]